jgi:hypothetical protein
LFVAHITTLIVGRVDEMIISPEHMHEYEISTFSLYAAASLGLRTADIISGLNRLSKVALSLSLSLSFFLSSPPLPMVGANGKMGVMDNHPGVV